jgi:hypothetical protein
MTLSAATPVAYFDGSVAPGVPLSKLSGLQKALSDKGWQLASAPPEHEGVWVLVSPSQALSQDTIERLVTFVAQGGKLVIFGEWGGYSGFQNPGTNALAHALGLHFNPDLIRDPSSTNQDWLTIQSFPPGLSVVDGIKSLKFYQSASLFGLSPVNILAQTAVGTRHVQDDSEGGPYSVVMGGPYKAGKAIALGDTSAFTDEDSDGNGIPNINEADNSRFIAQLFDW